jgi:hypothetical protein
MPVVKSPVLDAGPSSEVVDPITQQPTFSSEISDDDLDLLMTMIEKGNSLIKSLLYLLNLKFFRARPRQQHQQTR